MRFINGEDWFSGTKGFYRNAPEDKGGGGENKPEDKPEDKKDEFDPATITPAMQKYLDGLVAKAASDATEKAKADNIAEAKTAKDKADREAAKKKATADKDEEALKLIEKQEIEDQKAQLAKDKAEIELQKAETAKLKLVAKYDLPEGYEKRILGATQEEWDKDAQALAKDLPKHRVADTEGGSKDGKSTPQQQKESAVKKVNSIAGSMF